jgi:hypothetical protein
MRAVLKANNTANETLWLLLALTHVADGPNPRVLTCEAFLPGQHVACLACAPQGGPRARHADAADITWAAH